MTQDESNPEKAGLKISVVTVCFNDGDTIGDTIQSANCQTYRNFEHIFIDGASSDNTLEVIATNSSVEKVVLSDPDDGIYDAMNKGIEKAKGDIVGFLHADDCFADSKVLEDIAGCFSDPAIQAVYGDLQYVDKDNVGKVVRKWQCLEFTPERLKRGWMPPHPTLYVRRQWYSLAGGFDIRYRIAADYYFILQLFSEQNFRATYLPRVLIKMRTGGASNRSFANIWSKSLEDFSALRRSGIGGAWTLFAKNLRKISQFW